MAGAAQLSISGFRRIGGSACGPNSSVPGAARCFMECPLFRYVTLAQRRTMPLMSRREPYMDPSSFASTLFFGGKVRLLTYIRPLIAASIYRRRAMMGYSRASSQSLFRAFRTSALAGSAGAGSTCLPSSGLLSNRGWCAPLDYAVDRSLSRAWLQLATLSAW